MQKKYMEQTWGLSLIGSGVFFGIGSGYFSVSLSSFLPFLAISWALISTGYNLENKRLRKLIK